MAVTDPSVQIVVRAGGPGEPDAALRYVRELQEMGWLVLPDSDLFNQATTALRRERGS